MLETSNLSYSYPGNPAIEFPELKCARGTAHLILGKSGCGKTTLLHLMAGLMKPDRGSVKLANTDISSLSGGKLDRFRGRNIGIVFQQPHFIEALSVGENLAIARKLAGNPPDHQKISELLNHLDIADKIHKRPSQLSAGEQQRVAIARAMVNSPALLLADEPTSALDDENCVAVVKMLGELARDNESALVIVTHDTRLKESFPNQTILS